MFGFLFKETKVARPARLTDQDKFVAGRIEALVNHVGASILDFSLESLQRVDINIENLHGRIAGISNWSELPEDLQQEVQNTISLMGLYAGEVIKLMNEKADFHWYSFDEAFGLDRKFFQQMNATPENHPATLDHILISNARVGKVQSGMKLFPLSKVAKFLSNGTEDSLYALALHVSTMLKGNRVGNAMITGK